MDSGVYISSRVGPSSGGGTTPVTGRNGARKGFGMGFVCYQSHHEKSL